MLRVLAMDRALGNRPMTVGWGYFLSSLSLHASAQPSFQPILASDTNCLIRNNPCRTLINEFYLILVWGHADGNSPKERDRRPNSRVNAN